MRSNIQSGTSDFNDKRIIMGGKFFTQWMGEFTNKYSAATINTLEFDQTAVLYINQAAPLNQKNYIGD